jgi:hypothetical protein
MNRILIALGVGLLLGTTGCVSTLPSVDKWDAPTVAAKTSVTKDDFKKITSIKSPVVYYNKYRDPVAYEKYYLFANHKEGSDTTSYFIVVDTMRGHEASWAFWKEIYDKTGNKIPFTDEKREVISGRGVWEVGYAAVTREYLESIQNDVTAFKVYGSNANSTFDTYPNWVKGFLQKCDEQFPSKPKSTGL